MKKKRKKLLWAIRSNMCSTISPACNEYNAEVVVFCDTPGHEDVEFLIFRNNQQFVSRKTITAAEKKFKVSLKLAKKIVRALAK